ncbi:MAG: hypothetical protein Ta2G_09400 [Termitinemataceae bacterium]|nr:MAG: hypothetical protein Ta2G_09400 [Termitinemataceae bacterium]
MAWGLFNLFFGIFLVVTSSIGLVKKIKEIRARPYEAE